MDMQESGIRREIRKDPSTGIFTFNLLGLKGRLYDSQMGIAGKEIDTFPNDAPKVSVITPNVPLVILEADPVGTGDGVYDREPSFGADERLKLLDGGFSPDGLEILLKSMPSRIHKLREDPQHRDTYRQFYPYAAYHPRNTLGSETLMGRLLGFRVIAPTITNEIDKAKEHFDFHGRCLYCDLVSEERKKANAQESRVVFLTKHNLGIVPFSPSSTYSVHIFPTKHIARLTELTDEVIADLIPSLYRELLIIESRAFEYGGAESINVVAHSAPFYNNGGMLKNHAGEIDKFYHLHFEISTARIPRRKSENYELPGSGIFVSTTRPKDTARSLRL